MNHTLVYTKPYQDKCTSPVSISSPNDLLCIRPQTQHSRSPTITNPTTTTTSTSYFSCSSATTFISISTHIDPLQLVFIPTALPLKSDSALFPCFLLSLRLHLRLRSTSEESWLPSVNDFTTNSYRDHSIQI